jgi:hypothetical protein
MALISARTVVFNYVHAFGILLHLSLVLTLVLVWTRLSGISPNMSLVLVMFPMWIFALCTGLL